MHLLLLLLLFLLFETLVFRTSNLPYAVCASLSGKLNSCIYTQVTTNLKDRENYAIYIYIFFASFCIIRTDNKFFTYHLTTNTKKKNNNNKVREVNNNKSCFSNNNEQITNAHIRNERQLKHNYSVVQFMCS